MVPTVWEVTYEGQKVLTQCFGYREGEAWPGWGHGERFLTGEMLPWRSEDA